MKEEKTVGRMKSRKIALILIIALSIILFSTNVLSVGLSVSPAALSFDNVLKGGYAQGGVYVSTFYNGNSSVAFETDGDIKEWIRISYGGDDNASRIRFSGATPVYVKVIVEPPADTANGVYSGNLIIKNENLANPETGIGSSIMAQFGMKIYVTVTGEQIVACTGGGLSVTDAEINFPLIFSSMIENDGNVRISPQMFIDIYDKYQKEIVFSGSLPTQNVLPTETLEIRRELTTELSEDQYWARIKIPECNLETTQTFNILEKGGVSDRGELVRVENKPWASTEEIIPITAYFRNDGSRTVTARFRGEVLLGDKVVKIIDTDAIDANPGEVVMLQTFFKPGEVGQYFIRGKVYFNNKLTTEKASVLNVNLEGEASSSKIILWGIIFLIIIAIMVMAILIKRKKQKLRR